MDWAHNRLVHSSNSDRVNYAERSVCSHQIEVQARFQWGAVRTQTK